MKRKFLTAFLSMVLAMISVSCHSSEERIISFNDLPMHAQQFVNKHFAEVAVSHAEKEKDNGRWEYDVLLSDGTQLEFDAKGEWTSVDCKFSVMPDGIIPANIAADIAKRYPNQKPYKIEKELGGYEIDIPGYELYYNKAGVFIRVEADYH